MAAGATGVASLNVSVAAGVVLFEWRRRATPKNQTE
jgi:tRNA G18 (ribose-2'-O)-methylase SpoU